MNLSTFIFYGRILAAIIAGTLVVAGAGCFLAFLLVCFLEIVRT